MGTSYPATLYSLQNSQIGQTVSIFLFSNGFFPSSYGDHQDNSRLCFGVLGYLKNDSWEVIRYLAFFFLCNRLCRLEGQLSSMQLNFVRNILKFYFNKSNMFPHGYCSYILSRGYQSPNPFSILFSTSSYIHH